MKIIWHKARVFIWFAECVLAGLVGTGIWVFGEHLVSYGHTALGSMINFLAFVFFFMAVPITAQKIWPKPRFIWVIFGLFVFVMGALFIISSQTDPVPVELPPISLDVSSSVDPTDPFGTTFTICNQGHQTISNIWAIAYWTTDVERASVYTMAALNSFPKLRPTFKEALHFARTNLTSPQDDFPPFGHRTAVNVDIRFTPNSASHETNVTFQFCVYRQINGDYSWMPLGEGESLSEVIEQAKETPVRPVDLVPFLNVRIKTVENDSKTDNQYPIRLNYSWETLAAILQKIFSFSGQCLDPTILSICLGIIKMKATVISCGRR
jgi:hypothetical protein